MSRRAKQGGRSAYWALIIPLVVAAAAVVVSLFIPPRIGNWLAVGGVLLAVMCFGPALRRNGGAAFFLGRRGPPNLR